MGTCSILMCWLNWGYQGLISHSCLPSEVEERSVSKVSVKLQSLAGSLFPFRTLFQFTLWLTWEELLPAPLRAMQSHIPLRDDSFKEQFKCIVQRDFLKKAQKLFCSHLTREENKPPCYWKVSLFVYVLASEQILHACPKTLSNCL